MTNGIKSVSLMYNFGYNPFFEEWIIPMHLDFRVNFDLILPCY